MSAVSLFIDQDLLNPNDLDDQGNVREPQPVWKVYLKNEQGIVYEYVHENFQHQTDAQQKLDEFKSLVDVDDSWRKTGTWRKLP